MKRKLLLGVVALGLVGAGGLVFCCGPGARYFRTQEAKTAALAAGDVRLVAPDVMMVTMKNGKGAPLSEGPWAVRTKDGKEIAVREIHRHSYPVGQPGYEIGFGKDDDLRILEVEHRVFLTLASPLPSPTEGTATFGETSIPFRFDDTETETPTVQVNRVAYHPRATRRYAYVSLWMGDGGALSLDRLPKEVEVREGDKVLATLPIRERASEDSAAGGPVGEIDLSSIGATEGELHIRVPGVGVSVPFSVSAKDLFRPFYLTARGLFHNRWAGDLKPQYTDWPRPPDHLTVYTNERQEAFDLFEDEEPKTGERPLVGGYHDAGDFDQRPSHTVVAQTLMRIFEVRPEAFTDGQLTIPESGNGIPDLLDEAPWGIAGWAALQEKDGGVRGGVESYRHPWGIYFAHEDPLPYYTFARNPNVTARATGLFAQGSRLVAPYDAARAKDLKDRALRAWAWAKEHGATTPNLLYGASELLRLTGEPKYKAEFERLWKSIGPEGAFNRYANEQLDLSDYAEEGRVMPDFILGYLQSGQADPRIMDLAQGWMTRDADEVAARILDGPLAHRNGRRIEEFAWGQSVIMGRYLDAIVARMTLGDVPPSNMTRYFNAISVAADFVLGANPAGRSYITGIDKSSPREPLHLDSLVWRKQGKPPVPGLPVYGPVTNLPGHDWYAPGASALYPSFDEWPPLYRYVDIRTFVVNSEFTVWETQVPTVVHFALLIEPGSAPTKEMLPKAAR
ncbi:MAG: glycoside hydrolase family 9 protein [Myxococcales bacterium]|nr:glycoside hydrolase family 9 protein [Myxococcales bacterium]